MNEREKPAQRRPGMLLMAGLIAAPGFASWFLLRRGYSNQLRIAAFTYTAFVFVLGMVRILLYGQGFQ